mgnify:CR=1 FL=1
MHTFTGLVNRKKSKIKARTPASAARKLYKKVPGYKTKGARVISVTNSKGRVFRYRVSLQKVNNTVNFEDSASVTYKYRIKVRSLRKGSRGSKTSKKSKTKSKSTKSSKKTNSKTLKTASCTRCKSGKCSKCYHTHSIRPASGGGMFVI